MATFQRILKWVALVAFVLVFVGYGTLEFGTVTLNTIGFGLACWVASEL